MLELSLGDLASAGIVSLIAITGILEVSPIKVNPWSAIGKVINRPVLDKQVELEKKIDLMDGKIEDVKDRQEESEVKAARMRIQRFADELYSNVRHSKEHFDLILMDITQYNNYCNTHPGFVNEKTKVAQEIITDIYEKCLRDRSFER